MANSVDPDETPRSAASHLGLYCLLRPVCPNIYGKYGTLHLTYKIHLAILYRVIIDYHSTAYILNQHIQNQYKMCMEIIQENPVKSTNMY